jgi:hypothetical protein
MDTHGDPDQSPGIWAQSEVPEEGTIAWKFDVECAAKVVAWGVVWDLKPGPGLQDDADSYWVQIDGEQPEDKWVYGCGTGDLEGGWSYQRMNHNAGTDTCEIEERIWDLAAGNHELRLRNREGSDFQGAAGVARVLITTDANYVPTIQDD